MNNLITIMKSSRLTTRTSRSGALFASILVGIFLQIPGTATAQTSADLAIAIYNTPLDVYVNDYMPYTMFVTNLGPGTVSSVMVTNILPSGFSLINASPAYTLNGNTLTFNLGSLANLQVVKLSVRAVPASAGNYTFSASVGSTNNTDPNSVNNSTGFSINVGNYLSGSLSSSTNSSQIYDPQTGLVGQYIKISNNGAAVIPSARVVISGLAATNQLFVPAGTNNGNPFVIYGSPLAPGQSGSLLLEYAANNYFPFANSQLQPYATSLATLAPPANLGTAVTPNSEGRESSSAIAPGAVVVSWFSVTNRSYTVLYSDNPDFANPLMSSQIMPSSSGNQTTFIDYGPPATVSFPTNSAPRYYRVFLNP